MFFFEKHGMVEESFSCHFPMDINHFSLHFHRAFELIYVNAGQLHVSVDQKEFLLRKKDMAFIFPNQMHDFKTIDYSEIAIILFSPELVGDFFMNYKGVVPDDNVLHLEGGFDSKKLDSVYRQKSFLYEVCADLAEQKSFVPVEQSPQAKVLYKMLHYVEQNYSTDCTLKEVAKYLQYDYPYISKLFVQQMDMTFTDYLNHYRISRVCYLLKNSQQPIGEIAVNCGYNNLRTFHRNFREITNQSPREYRA